jgi:O-glycosyl hydrolase
MWNPPGPTDPIAFAFRMFRDYDSEGHQFGDTSINAVSSDQASLSIYAAQRSSDGAVTILAINKTTLPITSTIAVKNLSLAPSAHVFVYSATDLKSIARLPAVSIKAGSLTYTFPSYSAVMFVVKPST